MGSVEGILLRGRGTFHLLAGGAMIALCLPAPVRAELSLVSDNVGTLGMPGLIDMPSAEVAPDSNLGFTYSRIGPGSHATLNFQITPRLSGSFRYSGIADFDPVDGTTYERGFDFRFRVIEETRYRPAVSVGINDLVGSGLFSSEYVVATKSVGEKLRVTAGLGWGRLGTYQSLGSPFGARPAIGSDLGGVLTSNQWFRGPVAPFGGLSYDVNDRLTLKAEYSSDAYVQEVANGVISRRSPLSFGVDFQIKPGIHLAAYHAHGSSIGAQITFATNPRSPTARSGIEEAPLPVRPRPSRSADPAAWDTSWVSEPDVHPGIQAALAAALEKDGQSLEAMSLTAQRAEIRVTNHRYDAQAQAVGRAARMMTRAFPASVETFVVTSMRNGVPISSVRLKRSDIEALEHAPAPQILAQAEISDPAGGDSPGLTRVPDAYPKFTWALRPYLKVNLFDPDNPAQGDIGLRLSGRYEVSPGLIFSGSVTKKALGNLDVTSGPNSSVLPHVRSDLARYSAQGDPAIEHLTLAWYGRPGRDLYSRVTFGYLEPMFAGVSGELLWKPVDSRLAIGAELAYVRQRAYDQLFDLCGTECDNYGTVTGHVSAYYDLGNGFTTQLDLGRYLAGDYGATLSVDRVFANGWKVGAYATVTDVSAEDFGEGSFDKGIRVTVPMEWVLGKPTRSENNTVIRPLGKDGGARLDVNGRLYEWVNDGHENALTQRWGRFWR